MCFLHNPNQNYQNQNRNQGNNHEIPQGNNQGRNQFFQGASHGQNPPLAYQAPAYQAPGYQALVHQASIPKINKNLMRVLQVNQQVKAVTPSCETCGGPHSFNECPASVGQTQNVYAAGAYQGIKEIIILRGTTKEGTNSSRELTKANDAILKNMQTNMTSLINSNLELKNMFGQFIKMNTALSSGSGTLLGNTITNPKEDLKGITTRSGTAYPGPTIPTISSSPVVEHETETTKDTVHPTNNGTLADLGASINLTPLSVWNKLSFPDLSPTCMTLELTDHSISRPVGVAEDVFVKVGTFHFPDDFVVVDFDVDSRTSRYSANYNDMTANRIDVIDMACEEYSQEVFGFPINSDFLSEDVDAFLALEDDPTSSEVYQSYLDYEGDILLLEAFLNDDPSLPSSNQGNYLPEVRKELKICKAKSDKSSIDEPPEVELMTYLPISNTYF
nr:hypothetical protein [Tanacetum cinerariifolium]